MANTGLSSGAVPVSTVSSGIYACVLDPKPRFEIELLRWYAALTKAANVAPTDLFVSVVGHRRSRTADHLRRRGVNVLHVHPFDERSPHCNKIAGALGLACALEAVDLPVVLTDSDVVVLDDARAISLPPAAVALKTVDAPYPSLDVLTHVFDMAGIPHPPLTALYHVPTEKSFVTNGNGGVYILRSPQLQRLATEWKRWALWLLERRALLQGWQVHVDQVAMAMAIATTDSRFVPLDAKWNFPIHVPTWVSADAPTPSIIHYHDHVERNGMLRPFGAVAVDARIQLANRATRESTSDSVWTRFLWARSRLTGQIHSGGWA